MSQVRFHNYQRPVDSFQENRRLLGLLQPGRYRGFDGLASYVGLGGVIGHTTTGITQTNADNTTSTGPTGVWVAPNGMIIHETTALASIAFSTNAANAFERIDAVYGEQEWLASAGGQAAIYGVEEGATGGPVYPVVSDPLTQVILGYLHIPANASDLSAATWEAASIPMLGNADLIINHPELDTRYARLAFKNRFDCLNSFDQASAFGSVASGVWTPTEDGNTFLWPGAASNTITKIKSIGDGTEIKIYTTGGTGNTLSLNLSTATAGSDLGIRCPEWLLLAGGATMVIKESMSVTLTQIGGIWYVTEYTDVLADALLFTNGILLTLQTAVAAVKSPPIGVILPYDGAFTSFNLTGLGTGTYAGWAICNGLNGTPDMRGRTIMGAYDVPDTGAPALAAEVDPTAPYGGTNPPNLAMGGVGGEPHHVLTTPELPVHHHIVNTNNGATGMGSGSLPATTNTGSAGPGTDTADTGSGTAHNNLPPYLAAAWIKRIS